MAPRRSSKASEAGKLLRWVHNNPERKRVNKNEPIPGTRPVADPDARCVMCDELGADWYGQGGDAVHLKCFVRDVAPRKRDFDQARNR